MISSRHMQAVNIGALPSNEGKHALNRKGAPINEVTIEEILIVLRWISVQLVNIVQIVILAVYVPTYRYFLLVPNLVVHKGVITLQHLLTDVHDLQSKTFMQLFLIFEPLHQLHHPEYIEKYHCDVTVSFSSNFGPSYSFYTSIYLQFVYGCSFFGPLSLSSCNITNLLFLIASSFCFLQSISLLYIN